jgi:hypothetical protein
MTRAAAHAIHRVVSFEIEAGYEMRVRFDDGSEQRIDFEPVLEGAIYGPLRDLSTFRAARIDPVAHTLVWPNGADFDPATLHDWPRHAAAFAAHARRWREPEESDDL